MRFSTWGFLLGEASQNVVRNPVMSLASITSAAVALLVLAAFLVAGVNLGHLAGVLERQVEVRAFFRASTPRALVLRDAARVRSWPEVRLSRVVTKQEALRHLEREFGAQGALLAEVARSNPLLDSLEVKTTSPRAVMGVAARLRTLPGVATVTYQARVVQRMLALFDALRTAGLVFAGFLVFVALVIIHNSIRVAVAARWREIAIMRLVGARDSIIRWPFVLEGMFLGLVGGGVAAAITWVGYGELVRLVARTLPFLPVLPPSRPIADVVLLLLVAGWGMGGLASRLSVRRMLRG